MCTSNCRAQSWSSALAPHCKMPRMYTKLSITATSSRSHCWIFELRCVKGYTCRVWYYKSVFTFIAESVTFFSAHWKSDFKIMMTWTIRSVCFHKESHYKTMGTILIYFHIMWLKERITQKIRTPKYIFLHSSRIIVFVDGLLNIFDSTSDVLNFICACIIFFIDLGVSSCFCPFHRDMLCPSCGRKGERSVAELERVSWAYLMHRSCFDQEEGLRNVFRAVFIFCLKPETHQTNIKELLETKNCSQYAQPDHWIMDEQPAKLRWKAVEARVHFFSSFGKPINNSEHDCITIRGWLAGDEVQRDVGLGVMRDWQGMKKVGRWIFLC